MQPRVVFSTQPAFSGRSKDALPTTSKSNVVYSFTCTCGVAYVGKTSQCLSARVRQHILGKPMRPSPDLRKNCADSAIARHLKENPAYITPFVDQAFVVLAQARDRCHLDILEALFISRLVPSLCCQKDYVKL